MDKEMRELLETGLEFISHLQDSADTVVSTVRQGKNAEVMSLMSAFIDNIQTLLEAIELMQERGFAIKPDGIENQVADLLDAVTNQDYHLLADVIEYDLMDQLSVWLDKISEALE